jgi:hypothetical protein
MRRACRRLVADLTAYRRAPDLIADVLRQDRLDRGYAPSALRVSCITAGKALGDLVRLDFLVSDSPKIPARLTFRLDNRERPFPILFAEAPVA